MKRVAVGVALLVGVAVLVPSFAIDPVLGLVVLWWFAWLVAAAAVVALATFAVTRRKRWFDGATLVAVVWVALVTTFATLAIPQTVHRRADADRVPYGYPIRFLFADQTLWTPPSYPRTYGFNPWETPSSFSAQRFTVSLLTVYVALLALLRLALRARRPAPHARGGRGEQTRAPAGP